MKYLGECGRHRGRNFGFCLSQIFALASWVTNTNAIADGWSSLFFWCQENLWDEVVKSTDELYLSNVDKPTSFSVEARSSANSTFARS